MSNPFCTAVNPTVSVFSSGLSQIANTGRVSTGSTGSTLSKKVSLKAMTLDNNQQKVNDELGNPIIIGTVVIWQVVNPVKAVFNVQNYKTFLSIQCDSIVRNTARCYPYDTCESGDEKSLRGSSQEVADIMKQELQEKVSIAALKFLKYVSPICPMHRKSLQLCSSGSRQRLLLTPARRSLMAPSAW